MVKKNAMSTNDVLFANCRLTRTMTDSAYTFDVKVGVKRDLKHSKFA